MTKIAFARICVEIFADMPLPEAINVKLGDNMLSLKVDYQWTPDVCHKSCAFGHMCKNVEEVHVARTPRLHTGHDNGKNVAVESS